MKSAICVHPIKANKVIAEFVNTVASIPNHYFVIKSEKSAGMNFFVETIDEEVEEVAIIVPSWKYADYKNDVGGKKFRKDFESRCSSARGFADVTISILHEIGHRMSEDKLPTNYSRGKIYFDTVAQATTQDEMFKLYFAMPDEKLATDWAIEWLQDANNRKLAKAFEKKFWACFK